MSEPVVLSEARGAVLLVTLNRPGRLNAWTDEMETRYFDLLAAADRDPTVRAIVVTGAGRGFCAGADMGDLEGFGAGTSEYVPLERPKTFPLEVRKPLIAAINGACAGAGLSWACAADIRVASSATVFRTAFVAAAVGGDHGITWLLPRIIGVGRASELLLLSPRFDAGHALGIGLVSRVVEPDQLAATVDELTAELLQRAPGALASMKANLREGQSLSLGESLDREAERLTHAFRHPDSVEAAQAFFEHRPPVFGA